MLVSSLLTEQKVTKSQLQTLERILDDLFGTINVDINFTRHFFDRLLDDRNETDIEYDEVITLFKKLYQKYKEPLSTHRTEWEAVAKDMKTNINVPFALSWDDENQELDLYAKTVMRKKDFKSTTRVLPV